MLTQIDRYLLHRNHLIVQRRVFVVFCRPDEPSAALLGPFDMLWIPVPTLPELPEEDERLLFSVQISCLPEETGARLCGHALHLAVYTAGTAEVRINVWIHIPKISIRRRSHEQCRINRMTQIVSGAKVRTGTALTQIDAARFRSIEDFLCFF